jgi:hypothetical protein
MHRVHIYQILNHYTPRHELDPGFEVLDNSANERPDWFEYYPIRNFLLAGALDEEAFYGFLSPKFRHKTNLTAAHVHGFIEQGATAATDVCLFSPSIHNSAYYLSVFEHGESEHPGLMRVAERFFESIDPAVKIATLVSDSRNTVHSNYFIARPRFWRAWLEVTERLFVMAESPLDPLGRELCTPTSYRGQQNVQMKIFIMERVATWLLCRDRRFAALVRDPFAARSRVYKLPLALVCDALKIAFVTQGRGQYKDVFLMVRNARKLLNLQIRLADLLGSRRAAPALRALAAYWQPDERPTPEP